MSVRISVIYTEGCQHVPETLRRTAEVADRIVPESLIETIRVEDAAAAVKMGFRGSPTLQVNRVDIEGAESLDAAGPPGCDGLACRIYGPGSGVPPEWMIEAGILRALAPQHLLFLCVANSARSQLAEGIARSLAPRCVKVSSAGSVPTSIRPETITVLAEVGIDISNAESKSVDEAPTDDVDAVITLCADEVCPVYLGKATRLHWGLPDPAFASTDEAERLDAFRATRDELTRRLAVLFDGWPNQEGP